MRILIVTQYFWPENFRVNDLAVALKERGHEIVVLTGKPNYPEGRFFPGYGLFRHAGDDYGGVTVLRVPLLPRGKGGGFRLALNYLSFALSASLLAPWRCRGAFDAIFVFEPSPITVALPALVLRWWKKAPLLMWVLDLWPESVAAAGPVRSRALLAAIGRMVRFIYRRCDRILVQSQAFVPRVTAMGAPASKIGYFPSWAESVFTGAPAAGPAVPALPPGFRIMFAGNVGAAQDLQSVLAAAEILRPHRDIHWIVLGEGRMLEEIRSQVRARGLAGCVHLLGRYPLEAMPAFFRQADAMLVTLKRDPVFALTIPAKIQSYLGCGRPVLAMLDGEGARIVTEAGAGRAGPAENPRALADNALALYRMGAAERENIGRRAREYYDAHFERERLITQLEHWLREAAAAARG